MVWRVSAALDLFAGAREPRARPPAPGPVEQALRDQALERLEAERADWLTRIRQAMRVLFFERREAVLRDGGWDGPVGREADPWVSADDARRWFEDRDPPTSINRNFLGAVFRLRGWRPLLGRRILSATAGSHANELKLWTFYPLDGSPA